MYKKPHLRADIYTTTCLGFLTSPWGICPSVMLLDSSKYHPNLRDSFVSQRNHRDTTCVRNLTQDSWSLFPLLERSSHRSWHNGCISSFQSLIRSPPQGGLLWVPILPQSGEALPLPHRSMNTHKKKKKHEHEHSSLPLALPTTLHFS